MNPWLETLGVTLIAASGVLVGRGFSRFRGFYWTLGCFLPLVLIGLLLAARCAGPLPFAEPLRWLAMGRSKFVLLSLAVTIGLSTPISRLPYRFEKAIVCVIMVVCVAWVSVLPFLVPALLRGRLAGLDTTLDSNGICLQTTRYTCGPAAAVTALGRLGLPADEGEIAVLSRSSPLLGTLPACLSSALEHRYAAEGLNCRFRYFRSVDQLKETGVTLAVVRDAFLLDHCLVILEVSDDMVTVADPVYGKLSMSRAEFERVWKFSGIVLTRDQT